MNADVVKDIALRKSFVTTCHTGCNSNDIAGKVYHVSLWKGVNAATPLQVGRSDHGHLKFSSHFTELCHPRTGSEVTCSCSSFEV